jgi:uncharacterized protein (DUF1684 family)
LASIQAYRKDYSQGFIIDKHSPLKAADLKYLRFYEPDITYKVRATFVATPEADAFSMPTHSGKDKTYRQYGIITFRIHDTLLNLHVYQRVGGQEAANSLFIPFTDATTYGETFGGGRYLDLTVDDIQNNQLELDFNKCYNPYCAYAEGYSCPIPPRENSLPVAIRAGEKLFGKEAQ